MPGICRQSDIVAGDVGKLTNLSTTVFCNGEAIGLHPSVVTPHSPWGRPHPPHDRAVTIAPANSTVFCEGKPMVKTGDAISCGHTVTGGSNNTFIP